MIRAVHNRLGIPAEVLVRETPIGAKRPLARARPGKAPGSKAAGRSASKP